MSFIQVFLINLVEGIVGELGE